MSAMLDGLAVMIIPMGGFMALFLLVGLGQYIVNLIRGEAELPRIRLRENRGIVGTKIRRTKYEYIVVVPDCINPTKDFRVVKVRK